MKKTNGFCQFISQPRVLAFVLGLALLVASGAGRPAAAQGPVNQQVYLPLLVKTSVGDPLPPGVEQTAAFWLPSITGGKILPTYGTSVAVDRTGGIHVGYALYSGLDNGQKPAYYAYCGANCASLSGWSLTRLGNNVQDVRLALDPQTNQPRMMLYTSYSGNNIHEYVYAACNGGCTSSANWTLTVLTTTYEVPSRRSYNNNRYFAIDPQGGPGFIYTDNDDAHSGTFYAHCHYNCTNAGNWSELGLLPQAVGKPALAFTPGGQPRFAATYFVSDDPQYNRPLWKLFYMGCNVDCTDRESMWYLTVIYATIGDGYFSLRIDTNGRPRIALYATEADLSQIDPGYVYYAWCNNADCFNSGNWIETRVGLPLFTGEGVDLVLDQANRPRLAYQESDTGLGYAWCNGNCETASGWQSRTVESTAAVMAKYPPELPRHQGCPILTWLNGVRPSLALDPAGNPRVGYDTELWWGGSNPYIQCDIGVPIARFSLFPRP